MERCSRSDLLNVIDGLQGEVKLYKAKLHDLVVAYKSVVKEKEALESSLAVINNTCQSSDLATCESSTLAHPVDHDVMSQELCQDTGDKIVSEKAETAPLSLHDQIRTLTHSLVILSQEKSKMESQFVADNKQLRQKNDELLVSLEDEKKLYTSEQSKCDQCIKELQGQVRHGQLDRDSEQADHAAMLREIQKLLAEERAQKDHFESQLDAAQRCLIDMEALRCESQHYEKRCQVLQDELSSLRGSLQLKEEKSVKFLPPAVDPNDEIIKLKDWHHKILQQERQKVADVELNMKKQCEQSEEHVFNLEEKLSDLSDVVGNYEHLRTLDQQTIKKLRDRLTQLEAENSNIIRAAKSIESCEYPSDPQVLLNKIHHLKTQLFMANQQSGNAIDISGLFQCSHLSEICNECSHNKDEVERLTEEFERYKMKVQAVLKCKQTDTNSKEIQSLTVKISDLQEQLKMADLQHQDEIERLHVKLGDYSHSMLSQSDAYKFEVGNIQNAHKTEIFCLEMESKKQRERTIAMLADKDQEIAKLHLDISHKNENHHFTKLKSFSLENVHDNDGLLQGECDLENAISQLMSTQMTHRVPAVLHFTHETARQSIEIGTLRKQNYQLEADLHEFQHETALTEDQFQDTIVKLKDHISKLERDKNREGSSLEYLKNVLLKFFTSHDFYGRSQMLKAITTILQFSLDEKEAVVNYTHFKF